MTKAGFLGQGLDEAARQRGGWPSTVITHTVEAVGAGQVLVTGSEPVGVKRDGSPKFSAKARDYKAVLTRDEYRAAIAKALGEGQ